LPLTMQYGTSILRQRAGSQMTICREREREGGKTHKNKCSLVVRRGFGCHQDLLFEKKERNHGARASIFVCLCIPFLLVSFFFPQKRKKKAEKQESEKAETAENKNPKTIQSFFFQKRKYPTRFCIAHVRRRGQRTNGHGIAEQHTRHFE